MKRDGKISRHGGVPAEFLLLCSGVGLSMVVALGVFSDSIGNAFRTDGERLLCWVGGGTGCGDFSTSEATTVATAAMSNVERAHSEAIPAPDFQLVGHGNREVSVCVGDLCRPASIDWSTGEVFVGAYVVDGQLVLPESGAPPVGHIDDIQWNPSGVERLWNAQADTLWEQRERREREENAYYGGYSDLAELMRNQALNPQSGNLFGSNDFRLGEWGANDEEIRRARRAVVKLREPGVRDWDEKYSVLIRCPEPHGDSVCIPLLDPRKRLESNFLVEVLEPSLRMAKKGFSRRRDWRATGTKNGCFGSTTRTSPSPD